MDGMNRRSSILKPQKPRNPLSDLDFIEPVKVESPIITTTATTTRRSSLRRVSFASSNFVKEFATDPETNTVVWDTTYEETVNKSDSTTNSSEVTHNQCNTHSHSEKQSAVAIQHVIKVSEIDDISVSSNLTCVTTSRETMNIVSLVNVEPCAKHDNRKSSINFNEEGGEDIVSDSSLCDVNNFENRIIETGIIPSLHNIKNVDVIDISEKTDNIVVTQQILQAKQYHSEKINLDVDRLNSYSKVKILPPYTGNAPFLNLLGQPKNISLVNKENIPTHRDSRVTVPAFSVQSLSHPTVVMDDRRKTLSSEIEPFSKQKTYTRLNIGTVADNCNIEPSQQFFDIKKCSKKNETVVNSAPLLSGFSSKKWENKSEKPLNKGEYYEKNVTVIGDEPMEFTQQLPIINYSSNPTNKTTLMDESIECTEQLPVVEFQNPSVKERNKLIVKRGGNKTVLEDENMEITEQLPVIDFTSNSRNKTILMNENIECTEQLPIVNFQNRSVKERNKLVVKRDGNKTVLDDQNMEITEQLPVTDFTSNSRNKTILMSENIECTEQLPAINFLNSNVNKMNKLLNKKDGNKTILEDQNMEITQELPITHFSSNSGSKTTLMNENIQCPIVDFTNSNVNKMNKLYVRNDGNKTVLEDYNMEITQQLPVTDFSSNPTNKTTLLNENLECTKQLLITDSLNLNENKINKPLDIKDGNSTVLEDQNMEITQELPVTHFSCNLTNKITLRDENVECTKQLNVVDLQNHTGEETNKLIVTKDRNRTVLEDQNMEITAQLPIIRCNSSSRNKTCLMNENIECIEQIPAVHFLNSNVNEINKLLDIKDGNSTVLDDQNMEITQELPVTHFSCNLTNKITLREENVECTKQLPVVDSQNPIGEETNKLIVTKDGNRSVLEDINVKITQQFPVENKSYNPKNQTITVEENLKFTQQLGVPNSFLTDASKSINELRVKDDYKHSKLCDDSLQMKTTDCVQQFDRSNIKNESKIMNSVNDALQQFHVINNSMSTSYSSDKQNLNLLTGIEKANKLVAENVNKTETEIKKESKGAPKEINISKQNINCSGFKTPDPSLRSFVEFSPGIDDTQHLINYSLSRKTPNSDFSKIITSDFNPSFLSSKFMPLSEFSSDAFPVSLETTRNNQTYLEHMESDKVREPGVFPLVCDNSTLQFEYDELKLHIKGSAVTLPIEPVRDNQICDKPIELKEDKSCGAFPVADEIPVRQIPNDEDYEKYKKHKCETSTYNSDRTTTEVRNRGRISNLKRRSLDDIESVSMCKKPMLNNGENNDVEDEKMETSFIGSRTINISQENLTLSDSVASVSDTFTNEAKELIKNITQNITNTTMSTSTCHYETEILQQMEMKRARKEQDFQNFMKKMTADVSTLTKNSVIIDEMYNDEWKEISRPFKHLALEEVKNISDSSTDCSFFEPTSENNADVQQRPFILTKNDSSIEIEKILTLKEKIQEKLKRYKGYMNAVCVEDDKCQFNTLYKSIELTVQFNNESGIVKKIDICCNILDGLEPIALFVHKIFKDRLSEKIIQSAVGEQHDILTFLDYVHLNMQKMLGMLKEFDSFTQRFNMKMDRNFRVTFKIVVMQLRCTWCITIDLSDLENITEDSITAYAKIGTVNEKEIKSFVVACPRGLLFLRSFINNVFGYVDLLKKRKNFIKCKTR